MLKLWLKWLRRRVLDSMERPREAQERAFLRIRRELGLACASLEEVRQLTPAEGLGKSRVVAIARTSGTSGEPRLLPVNRAYLASLDRTLRAVIAFAARDFEGLLTARYVFASSRAVVGEKDGLPVVDLAGFSATRTPWPARLLTIPRDPWQQEWSAKAERIVEEARGKRVVAMSGLPALAIDLLERCEWPHLRVLIYGGGALTPAQRARLAGLKLYETYFATEAPIAFSTGSEALALNLNENLYLFDGLLAHELEEGRTYSLRVTTPGGLVNCALGDRVEVVSRRPLSIRFAGREHEELSMTGEKITLPQLDLALSRARVACASAFWIEEGPRLVWALSQPADAAALDDALCELNPLYAEALRVEKIIRPSRVALVAFAEAGRKPRRMFKSREEFESSPRAARSGES